MGVIAMETMTGLERAMAAIELRPPDRVPVDLHNFLPAARMLGIPMNEVYQNGELMAEAQIKAWRRFGHDVILHENGTAALAQACGCEVEYSPDKAPVVVAPVLKRLEDVDKLEIPDPYKAHPLPELLKGTKLIRREVGDKAYVMGRADQGPFDLAGMLRGFDDFLMDLAIGEKPELIHRLLDFCRRVATRFAYAQMEAGAHGTSIGEAFASPDVISPRHYQTYAFPHGQRMAAELREKGIILAYHVCGDTTSIIEKMVETGAPILEVDYKADLRKLREATRGKTCILGPIDPSGVMARGTPDDVEEKCREVIEVFGTEGGLILGPGCALPATTPPENIDAMIEAARKYGHAKH